MLAWIFTGLFFGIAIGIGKELITKSKTEDDMSVKQEMAAKEAVTNNYIMDIMVANTHLIGDKLLGILAHIFGQEDEHGVYSVVFHKDTPKNHEGENVLSKFYPESKSLVINLMAHFEMGLEKIKADNMYMGLWAYVWDQLLRSIWHEVRHAEEFSDANSIYDVVTDAEFEKRAEEYASDMMIELAKSVDIEPPPEAEFPFYAELLRAEYERLMDIDHPTKSDLVQQEIITGPNVYYESPVDGVKGTEITTMREWYRRVADDNDERWGAPVAGMMAQVKKPAAAEPEVTPDIVASQPAMEPRFPIPSGTADPKVDKVVGEQYGAEISAELAKQSMENNFMDDGMPNPFEEVGEPIEFGDIDAMPDMPASAAPSAPVFVPAAPAPASPSPTMAPSAPAPSGNSLGVLFKPKQEQAAPAVKPTLQLEPHNIPMEQQLTIVKKVLERLYVHIFSKCGFDPQSELGFNYVQGILNPVYIGDIPGANQVFHSMDIVEGKELKTDVRITDHIIGRILPKSGLPGYHLTLNVAGMKAKRSFIPQNHNKTDDNGQLKAWAIAARAGEMIGLFCETGRGIRITLRTPAEGGETIYDDKPFTKKS